MIKKINHDTIEWVVQAIVDNRKSLPQVYKNAMPDDLVNAKQHYLGG